MRRWRNGDTRGSMGEQLGLIEEDMHEMAFRGAFGSFRG